MERWGDGEIGRWGEFMKNEGTGPHLDSNLCVWAARRLMSPMPYLEHPALKTDLVVRAMRVV